MAFRLLLCMAVVLFVGGVRPVAHLPQKDELPDGAGKKILQASCMSCHELTEITKFRGYYGKAEWRDVVETMVKYGAVLADKDAAVLVEYLTTNLGKKE